MSITLMEKALLHCDRTAIVASEGVFSCRQSPDVSRKMPLRGKFNAMTLAPDKDHCHQNFSTLPAV
ncbi:MAG TPA: hypothetical protein PKV11_06680 [Smithella sp.]|nr:hypothetical protein [Smithella sp.]